VTGRRPGGDRVVDPALRLGAAVALPLARTTVGSTAFEAAFRSEALVVGGLDRHERLVARITGFEGPRARRRRRELDDRRRLAPSRPRDGADAPTVFWHGPDRVTKPGRPVIALVNGWTASGLVWPTALVDRLAHRHDVVRIDNRGTGYSRTAPAPFTIAQMADDVADVLRAVGAPAATVVGLSMGGMIAQEVALRHPALVERLVLCGTRPPTPAGFAPGDDVLAAVLATPAPGASLRTFVEQSWSTIAAPGFTADRPDAMRELVERVIERPTPRSGMFAQLRAISIWHGSERVRAIRAPTVVIHGRDDPLTPIGNGMRLAQLIPGARYVELPGVGHLVPFEAPDAVVDGVLDGPPTRTTQRGSRPGR
jgi:3-oxoadipate enol-lactonase